LSPDEQIHYRFVKYQSKRHLLHQAMDGSQQRLKGQSALMTGTNSGIGKAIAMAFAKERAQVVINYISDEDATNVILDAIKVFGGTAMGLGASHQTGWTGLVATLIQEMDED
jgi:NAD(P)-dependent dehydrogenase (short-subunit alcohol dehydrogenase family)